MSWRAWVRVLVLLAAWALVTSAGFAFMRWRIAVRVQEARYERQRLELMMRMTELGLSQEEFKRRLDAFDRRYGYADTEDHQDQR